MLGGIDRITTPVPSPKSYRPRGAVKSGLVWGSRGDGGTGFRGSLAAGAPAVLLTWGRSPPALRWVLEEGEGSDGGGTRAASPSSGKKKHGEGES